MLKLWVVLSVIQFSDSNAKNALVKMANLFTAVCTGHAWLEVVQTVVSLTLYDAVILTRCSTVCTTSSHAWPVQTVVNKLAILVILTIIMPSVAHVCINVIITYYNLIKSYQKSIIKNSPAVKKCAASVEKKL